LNESDVRLAKIRQQAIDELTLSKEHVNNSILSREQRAKYELVWRAYSRAELGIALAKLSFKEIKDQLGKMRDLTSLRKEIKTNLREDKVNIQLAKSGDLLEEAISKFRNDKAVEGVEIARRGRDILKILLFEENLARTSRNKENDPKKGEE
jgi:hypothetical protein